MNEHTITYSEYVDVKSKVRRPPGLCPTIVLNAGDPFKVENHCGQVTTIHTNDMLFSGLQPSFCITEVAGFQQGTQLELSPHACGALMGDWASEGIVSVRQARGSPLYQAFHRSSGSLDVADVLQRALAKSELPSRDLRRAAQALKNCPSLRISDLANKMGWTRQRLNRRFTRAYGVTPKVFARVARLEMALNFIERPQDQVQRADLATACGYFDQAHLSNDFKAMTGRTIQQWMSDR